MNLHIGCGTVYLRDWINMDIEASGYFLADEREDLVAENMTDIEHYYKRDVQKQDFMAGKMFKRRVVCDIFGDARDLPFFDGALDTILTVQMLEHFGKEEAIKLLRHWYMKLKSDGTLMIDVPDLSGTLRELENDMDWGLRLLYGSQKNEYAYHKYMYTKDSLTDVLKSIGFRHVAHDNFIEHTYPAFGLICKK